MAGGVPVLPASAIAKHDQSMTAAANNLRRLVAVLRSSRQTTGSDVVATLAVYRAVEGAWCEDHLMTALMAAINILADDPEYHADISEYDS